MNLEEFTEKVKQALRELESDRLDEEYIEELANQFRVEIEGVLNPTCGHLPNSRTGRCTFCDKVLYTVTS